MLRPSGATTCTQLSPENRSDNAGAAAWRCGSEAIEATTVDGSVEAGFDRSALAASWSAGRSSGAASWMPAMCDSIAVDLERDGRKYRLVDTAGIRRKSRVDEARSEEHHV